MAEVLRLQKNHHQQQDPPAFSCWAVLSTCSLQTLFSGRSNAWNHVTNVSFISSSNAWRHYPFELFVSRSNGWQQPYKIFCQPFAWLASSIQFFLLAIWTACITRPKLNGWKFFLCRTNRLALSIWNFSVAIHMVFETILNGWNICTMFPIRSLASLTSHWFWPFNHQISVSDFCVRGHLLGIKWAFRI